MSTVKSLVDGWVGVNGVPVMVAVGDEYDSNHPLVQQHPQMFTEPKRGPGRPPAAKAKDDDA